MKKGRNPIYRKGARNPFCSCYAACLDEAIGKSWLFWDCSECEFKVSRDPKTEIMNKSCDSMPYYEISIDVNEEP
ncbi:MAG: hypothetical protein ACM34H_08490 [Deltaproteobacteria bacterium]